MTMDLRTGLAALALAAGLALPAAPALAEMSEITIARQPSIGHLPLMIMQERRLIETMAEAEGLGEVKVNYATFAGGSNMNDALLSNTIQFAAGGVPPLILLWSKTAGTSNEVKGVAAMNSMPLLMNVNREDIRSIEDFKPGDKIALPSVKVSVQAMVLQMAAAKIWGDENYGKLDPLTVSMSHPDGLAALPRQAGGDGPFHRVARAGHGAARAGRPYGAELVRRDGRARDLQRRLDDQGLP